MPTSIDSRLLLEATDGQVVGGTIEAGRSRYLGSDARPRSFAGVGDHVRGDLRTDPSRSSPSRTLDAAIAFVETAGRNRSAVYCFTRSRAL